MLSETDETIERITDIEMLELSQSLLMLSMEWESWVHRRIDSFRFGVGERGVLRTSIDCTPVYSEELETWRREDTSSTDTSGSAETTPQSEDIKSPFITPLTLFTKNPLREFNARLGDGTPLPILGKNASSIAAASAIWCALKTEGVKVLHKEEAILALHSIASGQQKHAQSLAEVLIQRGEYNGLKVINSLREGSLAVHLIRQFAEKFWVLGVLERENGWVRQVIKIQYHNRLQPQNQNLFRDYSTALGYRDYEFAIPMLTPDATASYHLELHVPESLVCTNLELPGSLNSPQLSTMVRYEPRSCYPCTCLLH